MGAGAGEVHFMNSYQLEPVMNFVSASQLESVNGVDDLALKKDCSAPKTASAVAQEGFTWENRSYSGKFDF